MSTHHNHHDGHREPTSPSTITVAVSEEQTTQAGAALAAYTAEAARLTALEQDLTQHRRSITLAAVAQPLVHEHPTIAKFMLQPQQEGDRSVEVLGAAVDAHGEEVAVGDIERHAANELLTVQESPVLHEDSSAAEDRSTAAQVSAGRAAGGAASNAPRRRFIDLECLTAADYDAVLDAAEQQLGLIGQGGVLWDFAVEIQEGHTFPDDLSDREVIEAGQTGATHYRSIVSEGSGATDVEAESFHEAIGLTAHQLGLDSCVRTPTHDPRRSARLV